MIEVYDKDTKGSKPYRVRIDGAPLKKQERRTSQVRHDA